MKKTLYIIITLLVIVAMIFGGIYLNKKSIENAYLRGKIDDTWYDELKKLYP